MKQPTISALAITLMFFAGCSDESEKPGAEIEEKQATPARVATPAKVYGYKSGIIKYQSKVNETTVYFDDWGAVEARYSRQYAGFGAKKKLQKHQEIILHNKDGMFTYYTKTGLGLRRGALPGRGFKDPGLAVGETDERKRTKRLADELILGFTCKVYEVMMMKMWVHKGITLKTLHRKFGTGDKAVSFEPDADVDPAMLRFPEGVDPDAFKDQDDYMKEQSQRLKEMRKKGRKKR